MHAIGPRPSNGDLKKFNAIIIETRCFLKDYYKMIPEGNHDSF